MRTVVETLPREFSPGLDVDGWPTAGVTKGLALQDRLRLQLPGSVRVPTTEVVVLKLGDLGDQRPQVDVSDCDTSENLVRGLPAVLAGFVYEQEVGHLATLPASPAGSDFARAECHSLLRQCDGAAEDLPSVSEARPERAGRGADVLRDAVAGVISAAASLPGDPALALAGGAAGPAIVAAVELLVGVVRGPRTEQFARDVLAEAGLDSEALTDRLVSNPAAVELFVDALAAAERTASERKRQHLAKVVGSALLVGPDDARIDAATVLLRTVVALDEVDVRALIVLATVRPATGQLAGREMAGYMTEQEIAAAMGDTPADLVGPVLSRLASEALIVDVAPPASIRAADAGPRWSPTNYAMRFLEYLPAGYIGG